MTGFTIEQMGPQTVHATLHRNARRLAVRRGVLELRCNPRRRHRAGKRRRVRHPDGTPLQVEYTITPMRNVAARPWAPSPRAADFAASTLVRTSVTFPESIRSSPGCRYQPDQPLGVRQGDVQHALAIGREYPIKPLARSRARREDVSGVRSSWLTTEMNFDLSFFSRPALRSLAEVTTAPRSGCYRCASA